MENILEEEGLPLEGANVMDYEELYAEIEYAEEERMEKIQFERNCPKAFFDGYDRESALKNYEGITVQFKMSGILCFYQAVRTETARSHDHFLCCGVYGISCYG